MTYNLNGRGSKGGREYGENVGTSRIVASHTRGKAESIETKKRSRKREKMRMGYVRKNPAHKVERSLPSGTKGDRRSKTREGRGRKERGGQRKEKGAKVSIFMWKCKIQSNAGRNRIQLREGKKNMEDDQSK